MEANQAIPPGWIGADVGCGNGKYLQVNKDIAMVGCDRSSELIKIVQDRGCEGFVSDGLATGFKSACFVGHGISSKDFVISIAVIHHFSTPERRKAAIAELIRITKPGRDILIFVWAMEQEVMRPALTDQKDSKRRFDSQDEMVPWVTQRQTEAGRESVVYHRYYHLFWKGELEELCAGLDATVKRAGYDRDNHYSYVLRCCNAILFSERIIILPLVFAVSWICAIIQYPGQGYDQLKIYAISDLSVCVFCLVGQFVAKDIGRIKSVFFWGNAMLFVFGWEFFEKATGAGILDFVRLRGWNAWLSLPTLLVKLLYFQLWFRFAAFALLAVLFGLSFVLMIVCVVVAYCDGAFFRMRRWNTSILSAPYSFPIRSVFNPQSMKIASRTLNGSWIQTSREKECVICLEQLASTVKSTVVDLDAPAIDETAIILLDCNHAFHHECLTNWAMERGEKLTCPTCRGCVTVITDAPTEACLRDETLLEVSQTAEDI
ncbi:tRNA methyltransferase, has a role in tRNA modification [Kappamyces sp. JEL0829]|nr:tRNA methyltransferase, has a role in tRNA modification [Kappamyces sp. JEL0829]